MNNHIALYRKYRPQLFSDLVGQEAISRVLLSASKSDNFSHAYLFSGPRGTGKTSSARITAKAICCQTQKNGEPCTECDDCKAIENGNHPDLIEMDAASHTSVEDIRDLIEKAQFMPTRSKKKVYIIDEAHMLSKSAFNALLKTLEEPPAHVHFILATTEPQKLPATIISRCIRFDFRRITEADIASRLDFICKSEKFTADPEALLLIARQVSGGMRDAIGLLEQLSTQGDITLEAVTENLGLTSLPVLTDLYDAISADDTARSVELINTSANKGVNLTQFIKDFLAYVRTQMLDKVSSNQDTSKEIQIIDAFSLASTELKSAPIPQLPLEVAIISLAHTEKKTKISEPIEQKTPAPAKSPQASSPALAPQPEKKSAEAPQSKSSKSPSTLNKQALMEAITDPTVKMNLKTSEITFEGDEITIKNPNDFFVERLKEEKSTSAIATAYHTLTGTDTTPHITVIKSEIQLESVAPKTAPVPKKPEINMDELNDIFG